VFTDITHYITNCNQTHNQTTLNPIPKPTTNSKQSQGTKTENKKLELELGNWTQNRTNGVEVGKPELK
jgi:hypothetical protein